MAHNLRHGTLASVTLGLFIVGAAWAQPAGRPATGADNGDERWTSEFLVDKAELATTGRNPFFVLEPGYTLTLEDGDDRLVITVLDETRTVDGVETRVVEERESEDGELAEVSRNFYAISSRTSSVYYFGEEVDIYEGGKVVRHEGAWLSGEGHARFGMMMPGDALLGARHYQEFAPGVAQDRAEIVALGETFETPAGHFDHCLKVVETSPLEPSSRESKLYAPGIGLIQDGSLRLVQHGMGAGAH
ncbi:MAG: hypothetical protein IPJ41_04265 [Phycisphaerales bacterium]|nr:hypothetical protein [Phycisphaerales bacterium]